MTNQSLFIHEDDYPTFPADAAVEHLRGALRFPTVSSLDPDAMPYEALCAMQAYLRESYPCLREKAHWETIGHSLLITVPGTDPTLRPGLFMAHQDVVPVVPGTEANWIHGPFSGDLSDGYIWGRGSMDIKEMLIGILESAEYLLSEGKTFARTLYLAFGEDEETCSRGARAIVQKLHAEGVELEFVLDEGAGEVMDAADYGAPGHLICTVGMYEKGYADMRLFVHSQGGHASNPFHGTSLGLLSQAIARIVDDPPKAHLSEAVRRTLTLLSDRITTEPMRTYVTDMARYEADILSYMQKRESLYHQIRTTVAPTMITPGSPAGNVMPQDMEAVINFRLSPPDTPESLLRHCRERVPEGVEADYVQSIGPSVPSDPDAYGFRMLTETLSHYFDRLLFIPSQNRGATDARWYEELCRCVMRFGPFLEEEEISAEGIHGTNERIFVRAYLQGIRVLIRMMETTSVAERDKKA